MRRQGGGWQSGAAGETPTGRLAPAIGPKDDGGEESATDNRPAEARTQRMAKIPATSAKSATTMTSVVPPVVGIWQISTANTESPANGLNER